MSMMETFHIEPFQNPMKIEVGTDDGDFRGRYYYKAVAEDSLMMKLNGIGLTSCS